MRVIVALNPSVMKYRELVHIAVLENGVVMVVEVAPSQHAQRCAAEDLVATA